MPRWPASLHGDLTAFVHLHPGVRLGHMFGRPACFAGRRLFACLTETGLSVKLPTETAEREVRARRATPQTGRRKGSAWVLYSPRATGVSGHLVPILEVAARHAAERQGGERQGVGSH